MDKLMKIFLYTLLLSPFLSNAQFNSDTCWRWVAKGPDSLWLVRCNGSESVLINPRLTLAAGNAGKMTISDGSKWTLFDTTGKFYRWDSSYSSLKNKPTTISGYGITDAKGYTINVQALTSSPADGQKVYFGMLPKAPTTSANISKVHIRKAGTITSANIYCYSGTAGTNEAWSLYVRINNTTDHLIQTLSVNTSERIFTNSSLNIAVSPGDYIEIKSVNPTWATNPLTTIFGGYIYIE